MPLEPRFLGLKASALAATSIPVLGLVAGAAVNQSDVTAASPMRVAQAITIGLQLLAGCAWLWIDAKARQFELHPAYFLGLVVAPVVSVPLYFNQTRHRSERLKANAWFFVVAVSTVGAYWLGPVLSGGAR